MDEQYDGNASASQLDHETGDANEALGPKQPTTVLKYITEEPRKRKQSFAPAGGPGEIVHSSSHHTSDQQRPKIVKFSLPTVTTVARGKEAKGKERTPRHSVEDNQSASRSIEVEMVVPQRSVHFLVRDLEDSNNYHRAIYLRERSLPALIHGILQKFHGGSGNIAMLSFNNPAGVRVVVDDDVMLQLPDGKDLIVEFQRIKLDNTLIPVLGLHSSASSPVPPNHSSHFQSPQNHSRDQSASTETCLDSMFSDVASAATYITSDTPEYSQGEMNLSFGSATDWNESLTTFDSTLAADAGDALWLAFPDLSQWTPQAESAWDSSPLLSFKISPTTVSETDRVTTSERSETSAKSPPTSAPDSSASPMIKLEHKQDPAPPNQPSQLAKEEKKAELLEKNRVAATKCRGKRKMAEANLQDELRDKSQENYVLQETVRQLQGQADALNMIMAEHGACMDHERFSKAGNSFSAFEHDDVSIDEYSAELPSLSDDHWT